MGRGLRHTISDLIDPIARWLGVRDRSVFGLEIPPDSLPDFRTRMRALATVAPTYEIQERDAYRYWCRLENDGASISVEPRCLEVADGGPNSRPLHSETEFVVYMYARLVWTPLDRVEQQFTDAALSARGVRKLPAPPPPRAPRLATNA